MPSLSDLLIIPALTETDDAYILDVDLGKDSITEIFFNFSKIMDFIEQNLFTKLLCDEIF